MKTRNFHYIIIIIATLSTSCSKVVEDFPLQIYQPQIVINGMAQTDSVFSFMIAKTAMRNNLNDDWYMVTPSELILKQNGNDVELRYSSDSNLYLAENIKVQQQDKFVISASVKGLESVRAELTIPDSTGFTIENIEIIEEDNESTCYDCPPDYIEPKTYSLNMSLRLNDNPALDNFYSIKVERAMYNYIYSEGDYSNTGNKYDSLDSVLIFTPVEFSSWDGIYEFKNDYGLYTNTDITEETGGHTLYFKDELLSGLKHKISLKTDNLYFNSVSDSLVLRITFTTYSKDMYFYLRSLASYNSYYDFPLSEPVYIYTNIENGRGIFGAASQTSHTLIIKPD